jgi:Flp pilus assembly protein protease CpaA
MLKWTIDLLDKAGGRAAALGFLGVLLIAAISDLRGRRIPNWLTLSASVLALVLHGICTGWTGLLCSAAALTIAFVAGLAYYHFSAGEGIGGGDIKLMIASAGLWGLLPALYLALFSFAGHVLWMLGGWIRKGLFIANGRRLLRFMVFLVSPGAARVHFVPEGTPEQSPHAPFMFGGGLLLFALWQVRWLAF